MDYKGGAQELRSTLKSLLIPLLSDLLQENHRVQYIQKLQIPAFLSYYSSFQMLKMLSVYEEYLTSICGIKTIDMTIYLLFNY